MPVIPTGFLLDQLGKPTGSDSPVKMDVIINGDVDVK